MTSGAPPYIVNKRLEGRDEPVVDPSIPIIDAHHHLWLHPTLPYMLDDYAADAAAGHRIVGSVYVESLAFARPDGPEVLRPLGEIEFANGVAAMAHSGTYGSCRVAAAIVGYADLRVGDGIAALLDRALETAPERFRGVRQNTIEPADDALLRFMLHPPPRGIMRSDGFRPALRQVASRGLSFDAAVFHHQLDDVAVLADAIPQLSIVLNHLGLAVTVDLDAAARERVFADWRGKLRQLARRPNVFCKIGGLGLPFWGFGFETRSDPVGYLELAAAWRPHVETAIEAFGPDRCMMESDYSADARSCGFVPLWNALKYIVRGLSAGEKFALFYGTAAHAYRIRPPY